MLSFSLSSFLKICLLPPTKQVTEIHRKVTSSGGYDYYWTLSSAIIAKADGRTDDEILDILLSPSNAAEKELNKAAYNIFLQKFGKSKSLQVVNRPKMYTPPGANFVIKMGPTFSIETKLSQKVFAIWAMQKPELSQSGAAIGCYAMKEAYRTTTLANSQFSMADLVAAKLYSEKQIKSNTPIAFRSCVRTISQLIDEM